MKILNGFLYELTYSIIDLLEKVLDKVSNSNSNESIIKTKTCSTCLRKI